MTKRTRFGIRPDLHTTDEISKLAPEKGVIVFNKDLNINQYWNGSNWVSDSGYVVDDTQGYYGLLSATYFDGSATSVDIPAEQVGIWQDVVMTVQAPVSGVHLGGVVDERVVSMTNANSVGHLGTGSVGDPIVFLLEGLQTSSSCTFKTSLTFEPDEDGGRLDSRIFFNRHSGATPSGDFSIDAAGLAMESGADEEYPHIVNVQFFIGNTIDTNGVGDAGKFRFQVKSDVAGTVSMNKMALFIQL